ncbi:hypothetical protein MKW92_053819 [Papaver armeniacum]|nr:hypothetical protein MKW92_053819 [Papaver armeniacum]
MCSPWQLAIKQTQNLKRGKDHTRRDHKRTKGGKLEEREDERIKKASALMKEKYDGLRQVMKEVQENGVEKAVVSELVIESSLSVRDSSLVGNMSNEKTMEINSSKLVSESVVESSCVLRDSSMGGHMSSKKIMEINPENAVMEELRKRSDADMNDKFVRDLSLLLFEIASHLVTLLRKRSDAHIWLWPN